MTPDPHDARQDARSECRYTDDPASEPDLGEVKEELAGMRGDETEGGLGLVFRG